MPSVRHRKCVNRYLKTHTMYLNKTILFYIAVTLFLASCKKDKQTTANNPPGECVESRSAKSGDIIAGRYIIAYNNTVNARNMSFRSLEEKGQYEECFEIYLDALGLSDEDPTLHGKLAYISQELGFL